MPARPIAPPLRPRPTRHPRRLSTRGERRSDSPYGLASAPLVANLPRRPTFIRRYRPTVDRDLADGQRIAPGVTAVAAPGHTHGHTAVSIARGGQRAVHLGDLISYPLHVSTGWLPTWDVPRGEHVAATERRLFAELSASDTVVAASRVPFVGSLRKSDSGFALERA